MLSVSTAETFNNLIQNDAEWFSNKHFIAFMIEGWVGGFKITSSPHASQGRSEEADFTDFPRDRLIGGLLAYWFGDFSELG